MLHTRLPALTALLVTIQSVLCSPAILPPASSYVVKDSHRVPSIWKNVGPAPSDHIIKLQIGLKQSRFDELERHLYEVSDPTHRRYGQHLTTAEVNELIKPTDEAFQLTHEWLREHNVDFQSISYSPAKDWINIDLPVSVVERLLDTTYSVYEHKEDTSIIFRTPKWSLPAHLHAHISAIQPTNSFLRPYARRSTLKGSIEIWGWNGRSGPWKHLGSRPKPYNPSNSGSVATECNTTLITPDCLRALYGTINYSPQVPGDNKMALNDFLGEINNRSDVEIYLEMYRPEAVAAAYQFQQISIAGGTLQQTPLNKTQLDAGTGREGNLDAETMLGIAWPTPLIAYSTGGTNPTFIPDAFTPTDNDEPYLVWVNYVLAQSDLPQIISTSYGDDEQTISKSYAVTVCNQFAQLGARGVSLLFASGDEGVGAGGYCYTNDGRNASTFLPVFPATCPYVTVVGGTQGVNPEVAAYDPRFRILFTSGGGFSNYFARPDYQNRVVPKYLSKYVGNEYEGLYNPAGRGYPDIAAQSVNFSTIWNGTLFPLDGTSASTPAAAGVLALVNDALIAAGKSPLGFLNPWLYARGYKAFTDIVSGSSAGCNTVGFPAETGWDAVTGFGTPYFPRVVAELGLDVRC